MGSEGCHKGHTFVPLQPWRSEVQTGSHGAKTEVWVGLCSVGRLQRRICFQAFSSFLKCPYSLCCGPCSTSKHTAPPLCTGAPKAFSSADPCDYRDPTWVTHGNPHLKMRNSEPPAESLVLSGRELAGSEDKGPRRLWGAFHLSATLGKPLEGSTAARATLLGRCMSPHRPDLSC